MTTTHPRTRFAPSPTGPLHMGSLITALASFLHIKQQQGTWLVRIDNIDPPREQPGAVKGILDCLAAHKLHPDEPVQYQSDHQLDYDQALQELTPHLFFCDCSRRSLQAFPIYPGTCRSYKAEREDCAVRFEVGNTIISYNDGYSGQHEVDMAHQCGDFIVRRRDGLVAYNLATAVDDAAFDQILRGQDLQDVTPMQIAVLRALHQPVPSYAHIPVLCFEDGTKLSKQTHAPALEPRFAADNLRAALDYLNCPAPADLSLGDLLSWGIANWQLDKVPTRLAAFKPY